MYTAPTSSDMLPHGSCARGCATRALNPQRGGQVVEKGAMDVLFTADASPWAPDGATVSRVHAMLGEVHRCASGTPTLEAFAGGRNKGDENGV